MFSNAAAWLTQALRTLNTALTEDAEAGQGLVEYALILIFVSVVVILILVILAPGIGNTYSNLVRVL